MRARRGPYTGPMTRRRLDPQRLDVALLAQEGLNLQGQWPMAELPRLQQSQALPADAPAGAVYWSARGEQRAASGEGPQTWLHVAARTTVWLACQRCLAPLRLELAVEQPIRFVRGEDQAEALDAESEFDVLALVPVLDLRQLVEDELLLALPIVPRHDACPMPATGVGDDGAEADAPHPFAALARLKAGRGAR
jgi:uncharacterized protein